MNIHGDCLHVMAGMEANSVDSIVTDPPYELGFMGKAWDNSGITYRVEMWRSALRVLKPGGHLLAFGGSRTYHRLVCAIEDAGFEIRDQIMWLYGSWFPKSLDVSKTIDKAAGAQREVVGQRDRYHDGHIRQNLGGTGGEFLGLANGVADITAPATDAARKWQGFGTALKPAHEPIVVARKPLIGTVAQNVLAHGTGAFNIDGCRVGTTRRVPASHSITPATIGAIGIGAHRLESELNPSIGRWPANVIHDGSEEVLAGFPDVKGGVAVRAFGGNTFGGDKRKPPMEDLGYGDAGSAARFFYCAKASKTDREEGNTHPTVKPNDLMRYLCRLVTPPGGTVLDPFMGSGSTGKAAALEGFAFIGIEKDASYFEIAQARTTLKQMALV